MMRDFRFGCSFFRVEPGATFVQKCRQIEQHGYDTIHAPDHLGAPAPFSVLVAAAAATEQLRVGTMVLNVPFWNPALLAREVLTADILTNGRLEVGLGAGHMKWEFDEAGIDWESFGARANRLSDMISGLGRILGTELKALPGGEVLQPVQRSGFGGVGPPLLVGGTGDRILRIAAEHANIVGVAGVYQIKGKPPGTFRLGTAAEAEERVRFTREHAGDRADEIEWQLIIQMVVQTDDRQATAKDLISRFGASMTVDDALETPFLLLGTIEEMADQVMRNRERYGFSYVTVFEPFREAFAPVIDRIKGR